MLGGAVSGARGRNHPSVRLFDDVGLEEDPAGAIAGRVARAFPDSHVAMYGLASDQSIRVLRSSAGVSSLLDQVEWARRRQFQLVEDPLANRAVTSEVLFRGREEDLELVRGGLWRPFHAQHQLRVLLARDGRSTGMVALLRTARQGSFTDVETAALQDLVPDLLEVVPVVTALQAEDDGAQLGMVLDTFRQPAWLIDGRGRALFANECARALTRFPAWLRGAARGESVAPATTRRLLVGGRALTLVVGTSVAPAARLGGGLGEVAALAAEGMSDKEIAALTGRPIETVRTYVKRACKRLGVSGRRGLTRVLTARCPQLGTSSGGARPG